jgi:hypothetical protein
MFLKVNTCFPGSSDPAPAQVVPTVAFGVHLHVGIFGFESRQVLLQAVGKSLACEPGFGTAREGV